MGGERLGVNEPDTCTDFLSENWGENSAVALIGHLGG